MVVRASLPLVVASGDVDVPAEARQQHGNGVAVRLDTAARGLADDDGSRAAIDLRREVGRRREGRAPDEQVQLPTSVHLLRAEEVDERAVRRVVASPVQANVDDHAPRVGGEGESTDPAEYRRCRPDDGVVADVRGPSSGKGSRPQRLRAVREIQRPSGARQHRRVVPVQRIGELSRVLRAWHRRQRDVRALPSATLERELGRSRRVDDPEAVEHLRRERVVRSHAARVRRVVVRNQGVDQLEHTLDRDPVDRDEPVTHERPVHRVHDEDAVGEPIQANRIEMQRPHVAGIPGEEAGVPVARPERGDDPKDADEELVPRDARRAPGQRLHLGLEPPPRDAAEGRGMNLLDRRAEVAHVLGGGGGCGRTSLRRRDERDHGERQEEQARHPHGLG